MTQEKAKPPGGINAAPANETPTPRLNLPLLPAAHAPAGADTNVRTKKPRPWLKPPWKPGQSGNPSGAGHIKSRVRALARKHTEEALEALVGIMKNPRAPYAERRKAANDVLAWGYGKPIAAVLQQVTGQNGTPLGPLVNVTIGSQGQLAPEQAYKLMLEGRLEPDAAHSAFRPALEGDTSLSVVDGEATLPGTAAEVENGATSTTARLTEPSVIAESHRTDSEN